MEMFLWYSTLLNKDNWNAYLPFGCVYFNIALFHWSFLFFLFNIPWPDQILDTTLRSRQTESSSLSLWVCVCVYVRSISLWAYELIFLHALKLYQRKTVRSNRSTSDAVLQSLLAYRQNILLKLTLKRR